MRVVTDPGEFSALCRQDRCAGLITALVPTMGYFHAGHLSLMDHARSRAGRVYVSLFVNPTQFGPGEDLAAYPRDLDRDAALAESRGVDLLFAPEPGAMYAPDHATVVQVPALAEHLCGQSRPVHFQGVATVVAKLLILAAPSLAVFGQKDWQQLALVRRMARDLFLPTEILGRPIVREQDGLAMSSRNVYLTPEERAQAPQIRAGLLLVRERYAAGERDPAALRQVLAAHLAERLPLGAPDYLEFVDRDSIQPVAAADERTLAAVAVRLGRARLIDNIILAGDEVE
ncbi:MAG: pantoate--beta-alanine ligase [Thermodesulfobacteriota bacterium]